MSKQIDWQSLTIRDNFIFGKVLENNPTFCKWLLEKILGFEIDEIDYPEREKAVDTRKDSKGIRLDIFIRSSDGTKSYNLEMQVADNDDLAKRMRYYQGQLDNDSLDKGKHYWELTSSFIIFICNFDYFQRGRHIYTFHERCDEDNDLLLGDETTKIFLNTKGTMNDVNEDLLDFLDYVAGKKVDNTVINSINDEVAKIKQNKHWRGEYMRYQEEIAAQAHWAAEKARAQALEEGRSEGRKEGLNEGRKEGLDEGRKEKAIEMIKNLVAVGTPMEFIIKATGWSEKQILQISQ